MTVSVFLVDDHAVVREGLRLLLASEPSIEVVGEAGSGPQAVADAKRLQPDIAVVDIAMPMMNGIAVIRRISEKCAGTRSIVLSMHSTEEHVWQALKAGAMGYVLKEAAGAEIIRAIHAVSAGRRYLSAKVVALVLDEYCYHGHGGPAQASPLDALSAREQEVLQLVVEGRSSFDIGEYLHLSSKTVETYRSRLMRKLDIHNLPGLTKFAIKQGLTPLE